MARLAVYLVHGTWPFGLLGRRRGRSPEQSWFLEGSDFSNAVTESLPGEIQVRSFEWSGKNGFAARGDAAMKLAARLHSDSSSDPEDCRYVLIAHSHGGTVSANALALLGEMNVLDSPVKADDVAKRVVALVCMATPFAYMAEASVSHKVVFVLSTTAVFIAAAIMTVGHLCSGFVSAHPTWFAVAITLLGFLMVVVRFILFALVRPLQPLYVQSTDFPPLVPLFVLRAPQDEATMAILFAQTLHAVSREFYKAASPELFARSPFLLVLSFLLVAIPMLAIGQKLAPLAVPGLASPNLLQTVAGALAAGLAGAVFVACHFLTALSVGFWRVGWWSRVTVEVDVTPPGTWASVKVLEVDPAHNGLRHALHRRSDVRDELRRALQRWLSVSGGS